MSERAEGGRGTAASEGEGGRRLDARVAVEVFGREVEWGVSTVWDGGIVDGDVAFAGSVRRDLFGPSEPWSSEGVPYYSTDLEAAFEVVKKMAERGLDFELYMVSHMGALASFRDYEAPLDESADGRNLADPREGGAPLAICRAALQAIAATAPNPRTHPDSESPANPATPSSRP